MRLEDRKENATVQRLYRMRAEALYAVLRNYETLQRRGRDTCCSFNSVFIVQHKWNEHLHRLC